MYLILEKPLIPDVHNQLSPLLRQVDGGVLSLRLNRPRRLNALNRELLEELTEAFRNAKEDPSIRAVSLTGEGRAFCTGADLMEAASLRGQGAERILETHYRPLMMAIEALPQPLVVGLNGIAAGAGCALALSADIVLAAPDATYQFPFGKLGLVPDAGTTWFLPRRIGAARAQQLLMTNGVMTAEQALEWGAVAQVLASDELGHQLNELARRLAAGAPQATRALKKLLQASPATLEQQLCNEEVAQAQLLKTNDAVIGITAFLTKKTPKFTGN